MPSPSTFAHIEIDCGMWRHRNCVCTSTWIAMQGVASTGHGPTLNTRARTEHFHWQLTPLDCPRVSKNISCPYNMESSILFPQAFVFCCFNAWVPIVLKPQQVMELCQNFVAQCSNLRRFPLIRWMFASVCVCNNVCAYMGVIKMVWVHLAA